MKRLGLIILGASRYDHHPELDDVKYTRSAQAFRELFSDRTLLESYRIETLDRYDRPLLPGTLAMDILQFIKSERFDDLILYHCGHGCISRTNGKFYGYLRSTQDLAEAFTALSANELFGTIEHLIPETQALFVIDACFSGLAAEHASQIMNPRSATSRVDAQLIASLPRSGTAIFTATQEGEFAYALTGDELTLFTGSIVQAVQSGIPRVRKPSLSWYDINQEVLAISRNRASMRGMRAPPPRLHMLRQPGRDFTHSPFFRNAAHTPHKPRKPRVRLISDHGWDELRAHAAEARTKAPSRDGVVTPDVVPSEGARVPNEVSISRQWTEPAPDNRKATGDGARTEASADPLASPEQVTSRFNGARSQGPLVPPWIAALMAASALPGIVATGAVFARFKLQWGAYTPFDLGALIAGVCFIMVVAVLMAARRASLTDSELLGYWFAASSALVFAVADTVPFLGPISSIFVIVGTAVAAVVRRSATITPREITLYWLGAGVLSFHGLRTLFEGLGIHWRTYTSQDISVVAWCFGFGLFGSYVAVRWWPTLAWWNRILYVFCLAAAGCICLFFIFA